MTLNQYQSKKQANIKSHHTHSNNSQQNQQGLNNLLKINQLHQIKLTSLYNIQSYFNLISKYQNPNSIYYNENYLLNKNQNQIFHFPNIQFIESLNLNQINRKTKFQQKQTPDPTENINISIYNKIKQFQISYLNNIQINLFKSQKFQKVNFFTQKIIIHKFQPSKHYEIIKIQVQLLCYKTQFIILNELDTNPLQKLNHPSCFGTFGYIYFTTLLNEQLAIKSLSFPKINSSESKLIKLKNHLNVIRSTLKQYFFIVLFSQLKIGPKVKNIGGFDLVLYEDCIMFATEICTESHNDHQNNSQIVKSLFGMHMLKIVHRDIKPSNIMYSPTFNKNVYIDFGCTQALNEFLGERTITGYVGTTIFSSEELLKVMSLKKGQVDLYFNDFFGLAKSIANFQQNQTHLVKQIKQINKIKQIENFVSICFKNFLFMEKYEQFYQIWSMIKRNYKLDFEEIQIKLLIFFSQLRPSSQLRRIYWIQIDQNIKELPQFQQLNVVLQKQTSQLLYFIYIDQIKQNNYKNYSLIFSRLNIQNGKGSQKQKQIDLILLNSQNMQIFISETLENIKINQKLPQKSQFVQLCLVISHYSSLIQSFHQIKIKNKIKVCANLMNIINEYQREFENKFILFFLTPFRQFQSISNFYQYFMTQIFVHIPLKYKSISMIKSLSSLCFIGYPYGYPQTSKFIDFLILRNEDDNLNNILSMKNQLDHITPETENEQQIIRIQKINLFWQKKILFTLINDLFFNKHQCKFILQISNQQITFINSIINKTFNIETNPLNQKNIFFTYNNYFFHQLSQDHLIFNQKTFDSLYEYLNTDFFAQNNNQYCISQIKRWKFSAKISLFYISNMNKLKDKDKIIKQFQQSQIFSSHQHRLILPFLVYFYRQAISLQVIQTRYIFNKVDNVVITLNLSIRFKLVQRFYLALKRKNIHQIKIISELMAKQIIAKKDFYCYDVIILKRILSLIHMFVQDYVVQLESFDLQIVQILSAWRRIFQIGFQFSFIALTYYNQQYYFYRIQNQLIIQEDHQQIRIHVQLWSHTKEFILKLSQIGQIYNKIQQILNLNSKKFKIINLQIQFQQGQMHSNQMFHFGNPQYQVQPQTNYFLQQVGFIVHQKC